MPVRPAGTEPGWKPTLDILLNSSMEEIIDLPTEVTGSKKPANFFARAAALAVDAIILFVGLEVFAMFFRNLGTMEFYAFVTIIILGYFLGMETASIQGTIGKVLFRLKVSGKSGDRLSVGDAMLRLLCKVLSAGILGIGFLMPLWDAGKLALHDKLSRTVVHDA